MGSDVGGQIHGISLDSFLQMAQMEKTTCTLTVRTDSDLGFIYLLKGELIEAETGVLSSTDAAYEIISWENTVIEIENSCSKSVNNIKMPLMNILMEGLKIRDEKIAARKAAGEPAKPAPKPAPPPPSGGPAAGDKKEGDDGFKDLSQPAEKIEGKAPPSERTAVPKTSPPAPKKGFPVKMVAGAVILLGVIAGGLFGLGVFKTEDSGEQYQALLARLESEPSISEQINLLNQFAAAHPETEAAQKAEEKSRVIQSLLAEEEFDAVLDKVKELPLDGNYVGAATELFNRYMAQYPTGGFASEAKNKIAELKDTIENADYLRVKAAAKLPFEKKFETYNTYLEKYPEGKHHESVSALLSKMGDAYYQHLLSEAERCNEAKAYQKCVDIADNFIGAFRDSPKYEEVVALKITLAGKRDLAELKQSAEQSGSDYTAARKVYETYLSNHPDSLLKDAVDSEIAMLNQKIEKAAEWQQVKNMSETGHKDISSRYKGLESWIRENPDSPFMPEAKRLMKTLTTEKQAAEIQRKKEAEENRRIAILRLEEQKRRQQKARKMKLEQGLVTRMGQSGGRFLPSSNGTVTDTTTGLTWTILDSRGDLEKCLNFGSSENYVKGLRTGGYKDWRLPTAGELAGIYKNPPFFPTDRASWYWSSEAYVKGYHEVANVVTTKQETAYNIKQEKQDRCGDVRAVRP